MPTREEWDAFKVRSRTKLPPEVYDLLFGGTVVETTPELCRYMLDSLTGGVFLSRLLQIASEEADAQGWFCRTHSEWKSEIGLTKHKLTKYTKHLISKGVLHTKTKQVANGTPKKHYQIDAPALLVSVEEYRHNDNSL